LARKEDANITLVLEVGTYREVVVGRGDSQLTFSHATDLVVRKSNYVCNRTLMIGADKAANDFSRKLVEKAQNPCRKIKIKISVLN